MPEPPPTFWRVEWREGFGWPDCTRQERTSRNFTSRRTAAQQIAAIRALPSHHDLTGIFVGHTEWDPITYDDLIEGLEDEHDDDDAWRDGDPAVGTRGGPDAGAE